MSDLLEPDRTEIFAELKRIGALPDNEIPLAWTALLLGALDRPGTSLEPYQKHLDELTTAVSRRFDHPDPTGPGPVLSEGIAQARALSRVIADEYGYMGDRISYDDLRNANLIDVIERRKGLPVALGILYIHCAQTLGWDLAGLSFPGHFVVGLRDGGEYIILDPFNGGRILHADDLAELLQQLGGPAVQLDPTIIETVDNRRVLLRLENNIKGRLAADGDGETAAAVLQRMVLVAPNDPALWFELSESHAEAGKLGAAIQALENCLAKNPGQALKHDATLQLDSLRRKLN